MSQLLAIDYRKFHELDVSNQATDSWTTVAWEIHDVHQEGSIIYMRQGQRRPWFLQRLENIIQFLHNGPFNFFSFLDGHREKFSPPRWCPYIAWIQQSRSMDTAQMQILQIKMEWQTRNNTNMPPIFVELRYHTMRVIWNVMLEKKN